jgi:hypothetical protein
MLNFKMMIEKFKKLNMKLQTLYIYAGAIMVIALASCKKDLLKTNTDPNSVSVEVFDPNNLLTTTQLFYTGSTDNGIEIEETELQGAGCFIQHFASLSGYYFGDKYLLSYGGWGSYFDHAYTNQVKYAVDMLHSTQGKPQYKNLHQMARIMKALVFERITDIYGDVPYFHAGQAYISKTYFPAYDKQQDIYTDLLKEVSQAVDSLDVKADKPVGDIYYSGNDDQINQWKRFGNSLLLRMAMRLTKVDPATAKAYVTKVAGHTMQSNDDNAIVQHGTDQVTINKAWRGLGLDGDIALSGQLSKTFIDFLKNNDDPRLPIFAVVDSTGSSDPADQEGLPNGYDLGTTKYGITNYTGTPKYLGHLNLYSRPSPTIFNATAPTFILTYAESEFLLADAAKRWGVGGNAEEHYNNGVLAALTEVSAYGGTATVSDGDAQTYLDNHPYDDSKGLEMINTQYWATNLFNEFEAWSNYRRTGYPVLVPVVYPGSQSSGAIPRRMAYSTVDKQVNTANYNAAVAGLAGGDKITSRMWWDVK